MSISKDFIEKYKEAQNLIDNIKKEVKIKAEPIAELVNKIQYEKLNLYREHSLYYSETEIDFWENMTGIQFTFVHYYGLEKDENSVCFPMDYLFQDNIISILEKELEDIKTNKKQKEVDKDTIAKSIRKKQFETLCKEFGDTK